MKQKKKPTRAQKQARNKAGHKSVNSKYAQKKRLQGRGIYSPNSPFYQEGGEK